MRRGFNVLTGGFGVPIERMAEFRHALRSRGGRGEAAAARSHVGVQRAVYVTDDVADARAAAEEARWNMRVTLSLRNHYERVERGRAIAVPAPKEPDTDDLLDRFLVIGTPDTCIRQIKRLAGAVGITHFNCSFWFGDLEQAARAALDGALRQGSDARVRVVPVARGTPHPPSPLWGEGRVRGPVRCAILPGAWQTGVRSTNGRARH